MILRSADETLEYAPLDVGHLLLERCQQRIDLLLNGSHLQLQKRHLIQQGAHLEASHPTQFGQPEPTR